VDAGIHPVFGDEAQGGFRVSRWKVAVSQAEARYGKAADDDARPAQPEGCWIGRVLLVLLTHRSCSYQR
jgi:hypothetical protein